MKDKRWIQKAIKHKGALRRYVKRKYGDKAFTKRGTIRVEVLRKLAKNPRVSETTRRRARLALTLRKLRKRR